MSLVARYARPGGLPEQVADWSRDARDQFEERAGICEFVGGLPRAEAERVAEACVREEHARSGGGR